MQIQLKKALDYLLCFLLFYMSTVEVMAYWTAAERLSFEELYYSVPQVNCVSYIIEINV